MIDSHENTQLIEQSLRSNSVTVSVSEKRNQLICSLLSCRTISLVFGNVRAS